MRSDPATLGGLTDTGAMPTGFGVAPRRSGRISWRTLEWWGAGIALLLQSGAFFPLLLMDADGGLGDAARAKLRLLNMPVYVIAAILLARHPGQAVVAVRRSLPLLVLLSLCVLSVVWSQSPSISLRRVIGLLGSILLAYLLAVRFTPRQLLVLVACVLGAPMLLSLGALVAHPGVAELRGVFLSKNVLGWYAAYASVVGLALATDRSLGLRSQGCALFAMSLACLLASRSATALVSGMVALTLVMLHRTLARAQGAARVFWILVFALITIVVLLSLDFVIVPILDALGKDITLTGRVPLWALVDRAISYRPILGYGYQAFWTPTSSEAWRIWSEAGWMAPHAHNGYRDTMLSLGIVGTVALAWVILRGTAQGIELAHRAPADGWIWFNALFGMFLFMNLTESLMLSQNDFFWIMFSCSAVMFSLRYREASQ